MTILTEKQNDILQFIKDFQKKHGYQPSLYEVADDFGITPPAVKCHLDAIEAKGFIRRNKGIARSIEILK